MAKRSAGLLLYRWCGEQLELLLGHPGGPYFSRRDVGAWSVPKGLVEDGEEPLATARREFDEETGMDPGAGPFLPLGEVVQRGGKHVVVWAFEGSCDPETLHSNTFEMEWPRGSGEWREFPEMDRFAFFSPDAARDKILPAQAELVDRLQALLALH